MLLFPKPCKQIVTNLLIFLLFLVLLLSIINLGTATSPSDAGPFIAMRKNSKEHLRLQKEAESRFQGKMILTDPIDGTEEMNVEHIFNDVDDYNYDTEEDINFIPIPPVQELPFCGGNLEKSENQLAEDAIAVTTGRNDTFQKGKFILVATLDGRIFMLNSNTGEVVWSVCTGHVFSSTISTLQLSERGKFIKLIPSLTGGLYKYDGDSLQAIPLNADSLLKKSFKLAQDVVITGGKELKTFGINVESGHIKYECGVEGCKSPTTTTTSEEVGANNSNGVVLVIRKQVQTVRAIDSVSGAERWNFSVGMHELALAGLREGCYEPVTNSEEDIKQRLREQQFKMLIPEGLLFSTDSNNQPVWKHKFDNPISQAWVLEDGKLIALDPIKHSPPTLTNDLPSLYVGIHKQQLYVQESHSTSKTLHSVLELEGSSEENVTNEPLRIEWKPTIVRPVAEGEDQTAIAPVHSIPPFYVYDRDLIPAIEALPPNTSAGSDTDNVCLDGEEEEDNDSLEDVEEVPGNPLGIEDDPLSDTVTIGLATLWFWWKEVLGISLLTAVILNILLMRPVVYFVRRRTIQEMLNDFNLFLRRRQQNIPALPAASHAVRNSTSSTDTLENSINSSNLLLADHQRNRTISTSSTHSGNLELEQLLPFESQYLKEFEPIQCLGRGAFGTVFEAKKRIDDRNYAVKRIPLPNRPKSRDRVMREVKALARLEHRNIVRYFNAWIESPPQGWLEKYDPLWNQCNANSPTQTEMSDWSTNNPSTVFESRGSGDYQKKKDYCEITVPDKTPVDDDSFIVFEASQNSESFDKGRVISEEEISGEESDSPSDEEWSDDSVTPSTPDADNEPTSKFFFRPTTLDVLSSPDNSSAPVRSLLNPTVTEDDAGGDSNLLVTSSSIMYLYIQQELCQKRTLHDWLRQEQTRSLNQVIRIFSQIIEAVDYIHSNNLIHRDLKPGNIFLAGGEERNGDNITVKLGDFGLATTLVGEKEVQQQQGATLETNDRILMLKTPIASKAKLTGQVGTHLYMSPEQFQKRNYDHKVDIYSLGLIFFELLVPFSTDMERHNEISKVRKLRFSKPFKTMYPDQFELINQMVSHNPSLRPNTKEIKQYLDTSPSPQSTVHLGSLRSKSFPEQLIDPPKYIDVGRTYSKKRQQQRYNGKYHSAK